MFITNFRTSYEIVFNKRDSGDSKKRKKKDGDDEVDGPVVERLCPKCGHERMSYAALQLRSRTGPIPTSKSQVLRVVIMSKMKSLLLN